MFSYISRVVTASICLAVAVGCQSPIIPQTAPCTLESTLTLNTEHPKAARIQAIMEKYYALGVPGMTVLINDDNGTWYGSFGYADIEHEVPMSPCHINKLGSITKMMVGTVIWQLVEEGQLDIDAKIETYIPEVAARITNGPDITVAQLLSHRAGVYDIGRDIAFNLAVIHDFDRQWTAEEIIPYFEGKPATNQPGEAVNYANSHTILEALIIESVTGKPHRQVLEERIFSPLGMDQTVYFNYDEPFPLDNIAQGYMDFNNDGGSIQNISLLNPGNGVGYTGVYATVTDLYTYLNAYLREKTLVSSDNLNLIQSQSWPNRDTAWLATIGGFQNEFRKHLPEDQPSYGHTGGDIGYSANLSYMPHNNTIFAATYNYGINIRTDLGGEVVEMMVELAS